MYNFSVAYIFENEISWNNFIFYILPKFRKLDTWLNGKSIDGQTYSQMIDRHTENRCVGTTPTSEQSVSWKVSSLYAIDFTFQFLSVG